MFALIIILLIWSALFCFTWSSLLLVLVRLCLLFGPWVLLFFVTVRFIVLVLLVTFFRPLVSFSLFLSPILSHSLLLRLLSAVFPLLSPPVVFSFLPCVNLLWYPWFLKVLYLPALININIDHLFHSSVCSAFEFYIILQIRTQNSLFVLQHLKDKKISIDD